MNELDFKTEFINVLVIGCGGAGLRAAIEAKSLNLSVKVIGKRSKNDAHTVLAAGGINASFGNVDKNDSWEHHFTDTFLEGYGIGDPILIEFMAKESPSLVKEIDEWGANLQKLDNGNLDQRFFGAHSYRRTCYSGDYTGQSILEALLRKSEEINIPIEDDVYVTDLLVSARTCFGAMSINIIDGTRKVFYANSVIICTGGHTRIWKKSSSRIKENNGDGYFLALKAGCELIDMEMVQFHPTGMLFPEEIAGTLVTEAVRGEGGKLFNSKGERFMEKYDKKRLELSTRDRVAIANYTEIIEGRATKNGGVFLDISHKDKNFILNKIPKIYKQFLDYQNIDISEEPMEVAPTAHYSMGGIKVNNIDHSTSIKGLFAAGEVAGGLHGANRLGGNSLAEILVFGKQAGNAAANYVKNLKIKDTPKLNIEIFNKNIDEKLKSGSENIYEMQNQLRQIMWEFCGVVKDKQKLNEGLININKIKARFKNANINPASQILDLISCFDLEASIFTAESTIISALAREESRGAHQRNDFKSINKEFDCNFNIFLRNKNLEIKKIKFSPLNKELIELIKSREECTSIKDKLLE